MASKMRYKTYRDNVTIPTKFKNFEDELLALGFELDCLVITNQFLFTTRGWVYRNREEHVEAYISETFRRLWFSSYFEKGFDVSTRFRHGEVYDNEKIVSHVVETSISAAFDYHLHHRQKYIQQYGSIILFENTEQQIEWESQQNLSEEVNRETASKLWRVYGRIALGFVPLIAVALLVGLPFKIYLNTTMPEEADDIIRDWSLWFVVIGGLFVNVAWAFWPFVFPKTAEDRKGKKNVEASKDEKQDPYPF
jgi:hypothetical protein